MLERASGGEPDANGQYHRAERKSLNVRRCENFLRGCCIQRLFPSSVVVSGLLPDPHSMSDAPHVRDEVFLKSFFAQPHSYRKTKKAFLK